ncbi:unnamed protein product [Spodoptera littoralis]|uniref:PiggyBac transposable element-derived protein domain-containing protein n=1 Tax=Spodoptera littoralis TaxID=7109 RepID=A0A9P0IEZ4_SPOLI|nr:unnamed protein product [Spodoptera littoralis]CAH1644626.1 unnamed protein product [Spodoptera littoralis]
MAKRQLTQSEIQRALVESDNENIFVHECDSDDENFAVDSCSDSESNVTEPASENDDEQLWNNSDDDYKNTSQFTLIKEEITTCKSEPNRQNRTPRHNVIRGGIYKVILPPPGQTIIGPIDSFSLFFDDHVLQVIVNYTNTEGLRILQNRWKSTDIQSKCKYSEVFY